MLDFGLRFVFRFGGTAQEKRQEAEQNEKENENEAKSTVEVGPCQVTEGAGRHVCLHCDSSLAKKSQRRGKRGKERSKIEEGRGGREKDKGTHEGAGARSRSRWSRLPRSRNSRGRLSWSSRWTGSARSHELARARDASPQDDRRCPIGRKQIKNRK